MLRPSWVEIDLDALEHNVRVARELIGPSVKLVAVCKTDGYGCGAAAVAKAAVAAGASALSVGNPEDATAIRRNGVDAPILLYGSTLPEDAGKVAELDLIVTVHDFDSLRAFASLHRPVKAFIKVDSGFGRLGFGPNEWLRGFALAKQAPRLQVMGLYTHFSNPDDSALTEQQAALFRAACKDAESAGLSGLDIMAACSRTLIGFPELHLSSVDPGRMLYGQLEGEWKDRVQVEPVLSAVKSRIIQIKDLPTGRQLGYGNPHSGGPLRAAVIPIGFGDGFPRLPTEGSVLVEGRRANILGRRSLEHTVVDITQIPTAAVGSEVVLLGKQGDEEITFAEIVDTTGVPLSELLARLGRSLPRVYLRQTVRTKMGGRI